MSKKKKKISLGLKVLIVFLFVVIIECCFQVFMKSNNDNKIAENNSNLISDNIVEEEIIPDVTITLTAIGDIMCHNSNYNDAYDSETGRYDFSYVFTDIKDYVQSADIAVGNLETTFAGVERGV